MSTQPVVLVVEDNPDVREMLVVALRMWDYRVLTASNGVTGLGLVITEKPDVILLDVLMPEMSGEEFIHNLANEVRDIPIIVITALTDVARLERLWSLGVKQVVHKPFRLAALQEHLLSVKAAMYSLSSCVYR